MPNDSVYYFNHNDTVVMEALRAKYRIFINEGRDEKETPLDSYKTNVFQTRFGSFWQRERALVTISKDSVMYVSHWLRQLKPGVCNVYSGMMIRQIQQYQIDISKEKDYKNLGDPVSVLLNEFKCWLVSLSAYGETTGDLEACASEIACRIEYLEQIDQAQIFPFTTSKRGEPLIVKLMFELRRILQNTVQPYIKFIPESQTAREHFKNLSKQSSLILGEIIQVLFLALNPLDGLHTATWFYNEITLPIIRGDEESDAYNPATQKAISYLAGLALQELSLQCYSILSGEHDAALTHSLDLSKIFGSPSLGSETKPLPLEMLVENIKCKFKAKAKHSGIDHYFLTSAGESALTIFVEIHFLVYELAKTLKCLDSAQGISGEGGALLLYGILNNSSALFLTNYKALLQSISEKINKLDDLLVQRRTRSAFKSKNYGVWLTNHHEAKKEIGYFNNSCNEILKSLGNITSKLQGTRANLLIEGVMRRVNSFSRESCLVNNHLADKFPSLKLQRVPEKSLGYFITEPKIKEAKAITNSIERGKVKMRKQVEREDKHHISVSIAPSRAVGRSSDHVKKPRFKRIYNPEIKATLEDKIQEIENQRLHGGFSPFIRFLLRALQTGQKELKYQPSFIRSDLVRVRHDRFKTCFQATIQCVEIITDNCLEVIPSALLVKRWPVSEKDVYSYLKTLVTAEEESLCWYWRRYGFYKRVMKALKVYEAEHGNTALLQVATKLRQVKAELANATEMHDEERRINFHVKANLTKELKGAKQENEVLKVKCSKLASEKIKLKSELLEKDIHMKAKDQINQDLQKLVLSQSSLLEDQKQMFLDISMKYKVLDDLLRKQNLDPAESSESTTPSLFKP